MQIIDYSWVDKVLIKIFVKHLGIYSNLFVRVICKKNFAIWKLEVGNNFQSSTSCCNKHNFLYLLIFLRHAIPCQQNTPLVLGASHAQLKKEKTQRKFNALSGISRNWWIMSLLFSCRVCGENIVLTSLTNQIPTGYRLGTYQYFVRYSKCNIR